MLYFHELTTPLDKAVLPFLRMYQTLFPLAEQEMCADIIEILQQKTTGGAEEHRLLVAYAAELPVGLLWFGRREIADGTSLVTLWYIGVDRTVQSKGYGAALYTELCRQVFDEWQARLLFYEVDIVASAKDNAERDQAKRRLRFYERQGGKLLTGIAYELHVDWQPPVPMHLVIHPHPTLAPTTPEETYRLAKALYGDRLQQLPGQTFALIAPTHTFAH